MKSSERDSGIEILGTTPWGTHFCMFYQTEKDLLDILVPYFKAGLENNEYCIWITSEPLNEKDAEKAMRTVMPEFKDYFKKRQIEIVPYSEWYLQDGVFDLVRVLNSWIEKLEYALEKGFDGLRVTGNTAWLEKKDWSKFKDYEEAINTIINEYKMLVICSYALDKCEPLEILDVIQNHQFALIRREGKWNSFKSMEQIALEQKLKESEEKYKNERDKLLNILGSMEDGVYIVNQQFNIEYVNPILIKDFGLSEGKKCYEYFHDRIETCPWCKNKEVFAGNTVRWEWNSFKNQKTYDLIDTPLKNPDGSISKLEIFRDITERKKMKQKFKESEKKYRTLYKSSKDGIIMTDIEGKILECNQTYIDMLGYTTEELKDLTYQQITPEKWHEWEAEIVKNQFISRGYSDEFEKEYIKKDGTIFPVSLKGWVINDDQGNPVGMWGFVRDITERKKAEQKLKESEEKFRIITEQSLMGISIIQDGVFKYINKAMATISEYSIEEMMGWPLNGFAKIIYPDDLAFVMEQGAKKQAGEKDVVINYKVRIISKSGKIKWVENYSKSIFYNGKYADLNTVVDITEKVEAEQKLKESKEKLRKQNVFLNNIIESLTHPFFVINVKDYTIELANSTASAEGGDNQLFCYSLTHRRNKPCEYPCVCPLTEVIKTKKPCAVEHLHHDKEGNARLYEIQGYPILDKNGNVDQMIEYAIDITERKMAEQKLKESEEQYRNLINNIRDVITEVDSDGNILYSSPQVLDLLGYQSEELLRLNIIKFIHPDDISLVLEAMKNSLESFRSSSLELRMRHKNGKYLSISANGRLIKDNRNVKYLAVLRDITEQKKAEQKLKESEEKYSNLFQFSNDAILIHDFEGNIFEVNDRAIELFKYPKEEFLALTTPMLRIIEEQEKGEKVSEEFSKKGFIRFEFYFKRKDGTVFPAEVSSRAIEIQGKKLIQAVIRDITERKQIEHELLKINKLKSEFLRRASHELKTPLISIKGFSDLILAQYKEELNQDIISKLEEIDLGCERLQNIINDLLRTSRLESSELKPKLQREDLSFLINYCIDELSPIAVKREHSINIEIQGSIITRFEKEEIHDVISNLLTNAIKYTPPRGWIDIKTELIDDFVIVSIKDNGIGFTEEDKDKIFKQFGKIERYGQGLDLGIDGTGLGLYISKKIIESHSGKIWMESEGKNKGSTFYFSLPLIKN